MMPPEVADMVEHLKQVWSDRKIEVRWIPSTTQYQPSWFVQVFDEETGVKVDARWVKKDH